MSEKDIEQYWKKKEDDIGDKIIERMLAEFISGYQNFSGPILGILFYTKSAFYFQTFPRENWFFPLLKPGESLDRNKLLNFCIPWSNVKKIDFPPRKNPFLGIFLPQEYRIFIDYQNNENRTNLAIKMQSREDRDKLIEFYKNLRSS
ncbi:MAG TPA: hypothetical protein ENO17_01245 [Candidatus Atribacteria bacterium]|nr:hypothetical protein [Candidatus Atribacteria bacterium]